MWINPRWSSLVGPDADALRNIFQSIQDWTRAPTFGNVTNPTISAGGVKEDPTALEIYNEYIQSKGFISSSTNPTTATGWRISATGDAEFNNISIRGTFKTANSGRRIEIGTAATNIMQFFSGVIGEVVAAKIESSHNGTYETLKLYSPQFSLGASTIELTQANTISLRGHNVSMHNTNGGGTISVGAISDQCQISGTTGIYGRLQIDNDHTYLNNYDLFIKVGRLWVNTNGNTLGVGEGIATMGNTAGIRIGQRTRGNTDLAHSYAWYGSGDKLGLYAEGMGDFVEHRIVGTAHDWKVHALPSLAGTPMVFTGTAQIGPQTSRTAAKKDIEDLDRNPVWDFKPKRFLWREGEIGNAEDVNRYCPDGIAGLLVEDVAAVAPDAVNYDGDGNPVSLNDYALIGYLVKAVQDLRSVSLGEQELKNGH